MKFANWKAGNNPDIQEIVQDIALRYPREAIIHIVSYQIANDMNDIEWKKACYQSAVKLQNNMDQHNKTMLANIAIYEQDFETIIQLFENNIDYNKDSENLLHLAHAYANSPPRKASVEFVNKLGERLKKQSRYPAMIGVIQYKNGNFEEAESYLRAFINNEPDDLQCQLLLIQALIQSSKEEEAKKYLEALNINDLIGPPSEEMQLAAMLLRFDEVEKGLNYAYKIACNNLDDTNILTTYIGIFLSFLDETKSEEKNVVTMDSYVEFSHDGKNHGSVFIERKNNQKLNHYMHGRKAEKLFLGYKKGDIITDEQIIGKPSKYEILNILDKPSGLFKRIVDNPHSFSPDNLGIFKYSIEDTDGNINVDTLLDDLKKQANARKEQIDVITKLYIEKKLPLFYFATRESDIDIILIAEMIRIKNYNIKSCTGSIRQLNDAIGICRFAFEKDIVLDTYTAITAYEIEILPILKLLFPRLLISQSVMDEALMLKEKAKQIGNGAMWHDPNSNKNYLDKHSSEMKSKYILHHEKMIDAFRNTFEILPGEHPHTPTKEELNFLKNYISSYESGYVCINEKLPILSDDMHFRELLGGAPYKVKGIWLQVPLFLALQNKKIDIRTYTKSLAKLAELKHSHIFLDIESLKEACKLSEEVELHSLFHLLNFLITPNCDYSKHVNLLTNLLEFIWNAKENSEVINKQKATELILNRWETITKSYKGLLTFVKTMDNCIKNSGNTELENIVHKWLNNQGIPFE